jgi:hypothetical protein
MPKTRLWIILLSCCLFSLALSAQERKPGLWEMTTVMTWQQSPMPPGMPAGANSPFGGGPRTTQICLTQEQIDKYGAPVSESRDCQVINIVKNSSKMHAEMVCTGRMSGRGSLDSSFGDGIHAKGKVHFVGTIELGPQGSKPVEWTSESTSTYKGPNCGTVKPLPTSAK